MIRFSQTPTPERIRELLDYDPETGVLVWRKPGHGIHCGSPAGMQKRGYVVLVIDRQTRFAHRLAWAHYYGEQAQAQVDHVDGNGFNNSIANLRLCDSAQNQQNRVRFTSRTGLKGVTRLPNGRFQAQIKVNGRQTYLGTFGSAGEAGRAYDAVALQAFGAFARVNFQTQQSSRIASPSQQQEG